MVQDRVFSALFDGEPRRVQGACAMSAGELLGGPADASSGCRANGEPVAGGLARLLQPLLLGLQYRFLQRRTGPLQSYGLTSFVTGFPLDRARRLAPILAVEALWIARITKIRS